MARRKDNTIWYVAGGVAVLGGGAFLLAGGGTALYFLLRKPTQPTGQQQSQLAPQRGYVLANAKYSNISPSVGGKSVVDRKSILQTTSPHKAWYADGSKGPAASKAEQRASTAKKFLKTGLAVSGAAAFGPLGGAVGGALGSLLDLF